MENNSLPLGYVGGDIMTFGSQLARQYECDQMDAAKLPIRYYSPAQNKSINDKSNMTEEENNVLAEKITKADIDRLWESDFAVMCPEQSAIGTMCEMGCLFGWKYMVDRLMDICCEVGTIDEILASDELQKELLSRLLDEIIRIYNKNIFAHYMDIRTNHLNEKDWRRSFSINQLLYGMILYATTDNKLHENFDSVLSKLKKLYSPKENNTDE